MEKTITYKNSSIFYRIIGEGKTVVLIHGFPLTGDIWKEQADILKAHFKLIIPDLPGCGNSEPVPNITIEILAEIIKDIVDSEHPPATSQQKVTVIGHSLGGYIALAFAEKYPQYLDAFGLFHSTAFADSEEKKQGREKAIALIKEKGSDAFASANIPGLFTKTFAEQHPALVNELIETGKMFNADTLIQYQEAMKVRPDRTAVLKNFLNPILFLIGEHDNGIPLQSSLQQSYLPAQSHVHILKNSAHMGMFEETELANQYLLRFLNR
ncbi:MAG: alpha/beta hydrolase [Ferruginibacter sp.]|nr:alpha/beta hydrolase [Ferruginibacter sp.]